MLTRQRGHGAKAVTRPAADDLEQLVTGRDRVERRQRGGAPDHGNDRTRRTDCRSATGRPAGGGAAAAPLGRRVPFVVRYSACRSLGGHGSDRSQVLWGAGSMHEWCIQHPAPAAIRRYPWGFARSQIRDTYRSQFCTGQTPRIGRFRFVGEENETGDRPGCAGGSAVIWPPSAVGHCGDRDSWLVTLGPSVVDAGWPGAGTAGS